MKNEHKELVEEIKEDVRLLAYYGRIKAFDSINEKEKYIKEKLDKLKGIE